MCFRTTRSTFSSSARRSGGCSSRYAATVLALLRGMESSVLGGSAARRLGGSARPGHEAGGDAPEPGPRGRLAGGVAEEQLPGEATVEQHRAAAAESAH